jgi:CTP synthase (UTP-ammonia lyase)
VRHFGLEPEPDLDRWQAIVNALQAGRRATIAVVGYTQLPDSHVPCRAMTRRHQDNAGRPDWIEAEVSNRGQRCDSRRVHGPPGGFGERGSEG